MFRAPHQPAVQPHDQLDHRRQHRCGVPAGTVLPGVPAGSQQPRQTDATCALGRPADRRTALRVGTGLAEQRRARRTTHRPRYVGEPSASAPASTAAPLRRERTSAASAAPQERSTCDVGRRYELRAPAAAADSRGGSQRRSGDAAPAAGPAREVQRDPGQGHDQGQRPGQKRFRSSPTTARSSRSARPSTHSRVASRSWRPATAGRHRHGRVLRRHLQDRPDEGHQAH